MRMAHLILRVELDTAGSWAEVYVPPIAQGSPSLNRTSRGLTALERTQILRVALKMQDSLAEALHV